MKLKRERHTYRGIKKERKLGEDEEEEKLMQYLLDIEVRGNQARHESE